VSEARQVGALMDGVVGNKSRIKSRVNLCEPDVVIGPSIIVFVRNSTPEHYDAMQIIALGPKNCICVSNSPWPAKPQVSATTLYVRSSSSRTIMLTTAGEHTSENLVRIWPLTAPDVVVLNR
jgi:hypothetical protein